MSKVSLKLVERIYSQKCILDNGGVVLNCIIEAKAGEDVFGEKSRGYSLITLDGYAIIPKEKHLELIEPKKGFFERLRGMIMGRQK